MRPRGAVLYLRRRLGWKRWDNMIYTIAAAAATATLGRKRREKGGLNGR